MQKYVARGTRVIHVGDAILVPGIPVPVDPEALKHPVADAMLKAKEIEPATAEDEPVPEHAPKPASKRT